MLLRIVRMLKKKLSLEAIEKGYYEIRYYYKISSTLIIPNGCEKIGIRAFWHCDRLKKVKIPESVEYIELAAFESCDRLEKVVIPKSVKEIGDYAFDWCDKATIILKKPRSEFKFIGYRTFYGVRDVKEETRN